MVVKCLHSENGRRAEEGQTKHTNRVGGVLTVGTCKTLEIICKTQRNIYGVCTIRPKLGVFLKMFKIQLFCRFSTQLVKKLQQWSLCEMIEDVLPFVLNTKRPLSDIWLLKYKQNSFGWKKFRTLFFSKTPKTVLLISQQPNISQRPFYIIV